MTDDPYPALATAGTRKAAVAELTAAAWRDTDDGKNLEIRLPVPDCA